MSHNDPLLKWLGEYSVWICEQNYTHEYMNKWIWTVPSIYCKYIAEVKSGKKSLDGTLIKRFEQIFIPRGFEMYLHNLPGLL